MEIVVVVAIVVTTALAGVAISLGSRSFAVATAASEFDHLLDSARTVARETQGATLVFAPDVFGDGTEVRVLTPGPNGALSPTNLPPLHTRAAIEESESLGKAPFAFIVHSTGALGGRPGYRTGNPNTIPEIGCPPTGWFHFLIHAAGATAERTLPCRITLAATAPAALPTWPPASIAPLPTPCSTGPCAPAALPTPPSSPATCPPNFTAITAGCTPSSGKSSAPQYHVTASLTSQTLAVGGTDSLAATATLLNAASVPAGTPSTLAVVASNLTASTCSAAKTGPQQIGSVFVITGLAQGTCSVTLTADTSTVPNASSDSTTISASVLPNQPPAPGAGQPPCDLQANGKCYQRIVGETAQAFTKTVFPGTQCTDGTGGNSCSYIDSIARIELAYSYGFRPPVPVDASHEILFKVLRIIGATYECEPYLVFADIPAPNPIQWAGATVGAPTNSPVGTGQPGQYITLNHVYSGFTDSGIWDETDLTWRAGTTLLALYDAVAMQKTGTEYSFTYSLPTAASDYVLWSPDFPGCDASGDSGQTATQYGVAGANIVFEIYQAVQ
ncbi:MAG TPA: hypothetical protein VHS78_17540 [Candidatus Elarobacter sp.]|nr:hypothetical protein [Candidatus Elarobacter sp.]